MKIPLTLNEEKIVLDANPKSSILSVLRKKNLISVKCGCTKGFCGSCIILLDQKIAPSCIIPIALARDCSIITLEYFSKTEDYTDISKGFAKAGITLCGYCNAGKIFTAYHVLNSSAKINRAFIKTQVQHLSPCCTDAEQLVDGILYALDYKILRIGVHKNAK